MKKKILSVVLMLALALSLAIGTAVMSSAATEGYLGTSAKLAENITIQVKFDLDTCTSATVKVGGNAATDAAYTVSDGVVTVYAELAVKDIDKALVVTASDGTNTYTKSTLEDGTTPFTAKAYLGGLGETIYADLATALISYGDIAKKYFAKEALTATGTPSIPSTYETTGTLPAGLVHKSATLFLETKTTIRHYFEGDITGYTFTLGDDILVPEEKDGMYFVDIDGITPKDLDHPYTISVTKEGMAAPYTCAYSALDYAARAFTAGGTDSRRALAEVLYGYSVAAENTKGKITYVVNGGRALVNPTTEFVPDEAAKLPYNAAHPYAVLAGWYFDSELTQPANGVSVSESYTDVTLYAKWVRAFESSVDITSTTYGYDDDNPGDLGAVMDANDATITFTYIPSKANTFTDISTLPASKEWSSYDTVRVFPGTGAENGTGAAYMVNVLYLYNDSVYAETPIIKTEDETGLMLDPDVKPIASVSAQDRIDLVMTFDFMSGEFTWKFYVNGVDIGVTKSGKCQSDSSNYYYKKYQTNGVQRNSFWQYYDPSSDTATGVKHSIAICGGNIYANKSAGGSAGGNEAVQIEHYTGNNWRTATDFDYGTWLSENGGKMTVRYTPVSARTNWDYTYGIDVVNFTNNTKKVILNYVYQREDKVYINNPGNGAEPVGTPVATVGDGKYVDMVMTFDFTNETAGSVNVDYYVDNEYVGSKSVNNSSYITVANLNYDSTDSFPSIYWGYIPDQRSEADKSNWKYDITSFEGNLYEGMICEAPTVMEATESWYSSSNGVDFGTWLTNPANGTKLTFRYEAIKSKTDWTGIETDLEGSDTIDILTYNKTDVQYVLYILEDKIYIDAPYTRPKIDLDGDGLYTSEGERPLTPTDAQPIATYPTDGERLIIDMVLDFDFTKGKMYVTYYLNGVYVKSKTLACNTDYTKYDTSAQDFKSLWRYAAGNTGKDPKHAVSIFAGDIYAKYVD